MIRFFGIMGLLGAVTFLVLLIISIFRKTPKQKWVIGILASVLFISFSMTLSFAVDINVLEKELEEMTEAKESLESDRNLSELSEALDEHFDNILEDVKEDVKSKLIDMVADYLGENTSWIDGALVYIIPVEGVSPQEIFDNALSVMRKVNESILPLISLKSSVGKEHFYFRIVDKNGLIVMERNMSTDGKFSYFTIGVDYLQYMDRLH